MKTPPDKQSVDKPHAPPRKIPSWRSAVLPPAAAPRAPLSQLPTLEALAAVAATMANPAEKPAATARRAMELFAACERELLEMAKENESREALAKRLSDVFEYEQAFLSNFKAGPHLGYDSFKPGERVSLDEFLTACMPRSKEEDRMGKWRSFIALKLYRTGGRIGLPQLNKSQSAEWAPKLVERFRTEGLSVDLRLAGVRDAFLDFLDDDRKTQASERGKKGGRPKKCLGPAKQT